MAKSNSLILESRDEFTEKHREALGALVVELGGEADNFQISFKPGDTQATMRISSTFRDGTKTTICTKAEYPKLYKRIQDLYANDENLG